MILLKLGGSLITNKSKPYSERAEVIADLVGQIKKAWKEKKKPLIVGNGAGSFAHVPAEKYETIKGNINGQSVYGAAMVADAACQLNRIVVAEFLRQKLPAVSLGPLSYMTVKGGRARVFIDSIEEAVKLKMIPVIYGDLIFDKKQGFTIWSTERLLNLLALEYLRQGRKVDKVIHCGETDGFMVKRKVLKKINGEGLRKIKKYISDTQGFDVTGGMLHKLKECVQTAKQGVDSYIIGGNHGGNLYRAIVGEKFVGTRVTV